MCYRSWVPCPYGAHCQHPRRDRQGLQTSLFADAVTRWPRDRIEDCRRSYCYGIIELPEDKIRLCQPYLDHYGGSPSGHQDVKKSVGLAGQPGATVQKPLAASNQYTGGSTVAQGPSAPSNEPLTSSAPKPKQHGEYVSPYGPPPLSQKGGYVSPYPPLGSGQNHEYVSPYPTLGQQPAPTTRGATSGRPQTSTTTRPSVRSDTSDTAEDPAQTDFNRAMEARWPGRIWTSPGGRFNTPLDWFREVVVSDIRKRRYRFAYKHAFHDPRPLPYEDYNDFLNRKSDTLARDETGFFEVLYNAWRNSPTNANILP